MTSVEHQYAAQPSDCRRGRSDPGVVRLRCTFGHQRGRLVRQSIGHEVFELARLVAAKGETGEIVALEIDAWAPRTERRLQVPGALQRRGQRRQGISG